jgi:hypothetical protein
LKSVTIKGKKKALAKLLNRGKPLWVAGERRAAHGEANILELVRDNGSRFEPREAIQASHFPQPVDRDQRRDAL